MYCVFVPNCTKITSRPPADAEEIKHRPLATVYPVFIPLHAPIVPSSLFVFSRVTLFPLLNVNR